MADELHYSSRPDNKRKFEEPGDGGAPSPPARRPSGFSAPIASSSPDVSSGGAVPAQQTYNSVPPPLDGIQLAKQRAQEIAARLFSDAEAKRPRVENGGGTGDSKDTSFGSATGDNILKPISQQLPSQTSLTSHPLPSYGYQGSSKKIEIPNGRVGVIIGKSGETIKYLQLQSGAKIQVTRDMDADPNSLTRSVEIVGTSEQISRAEQLINDVLAEADAGASATIASRKFGSVQPGADQFQMKVPNNKVGMVIGKGGETIKSMQARSGARIQVIPLHLPPGDTSTERTVYIDGTQEQIEIAKQLVNEVISENRARNPAMAGGYPQQGYHAPRPPTSWVPPGAPPVQQPGYGYMPPGAYPGPPPPYNMPHPSYGGYPPGWDQTSNQTSQQTAPGTGYDYYNPQSQQQQPSLGGPTTGSGGYNYGQALPNYSNQASYGDAAYPQTSAGQQSYVQDGYSSGYNAPALQPGYSQTTPNPQGGYDQQGYSSTSYGTVAAPSQDGSANAYSAPSGSTQAPPAQQPPLSQPPNNTTAGYPSQATAPSGYGCRFPRRYHIGTCGFFLCLSLFPPPIAAGDLDPLSHLMEAAGAGLFLSRSALPAAASWKEARFLGPARTRPRKTVAMAMENNVAGGGGGYAGMPNSNYVVSLDIAPSSLTRPLNEILRDLNKRVPDKIIDAHHNSIPWYHTNRMLSFYAPGWCGEVRDVVFSDNGTVTVVYRVTIRGSDGEAHRESSSTVSLNDAQFGDPVAAAEELAFCKACARFGFGLYLYHED